MEPGTINEGHMDYDKIEIDDVTCFAGLNHGDCNSKNKIIPVRPIGYVVKALPSDFKERCYAVNNDLLAHSDDYIKSGYLKLLGVLLYQFDEIVTTQNLLYKGIIKGAEADKQVNEQYEYYLRTAAGAKYEDYAGFFDACRANPLKYSFVLDAIILTCLQTEREAQFKLITLFCRAMQLTEDEVTTLATMAEAIVKLDIFLFAEAYKIKTSSISDKVLLGYFNLIQTYYRNSENLTIVHPIALSTSSQSIISKCNEASSVAFLNLSLNLTKILNITTSDEKGLRGTLDFYNKNKVMFLACNISGEKTAIRLNGCQEVRCYDSIFCNFKERVFYIKAVKNVLVEYCKFNECWQYTYRREYKSNISGGIFYWDNIEESKSLRIGLKNCVFKSCGTSAYNRYTGRFGISNIDCDVVNSIFYNCGSFKYRNKPYRTYAVDPSKPLFTPNTRISDNCKFQDCGNPK